MASADLEIATDLVGKEEETQAEPEASSSSTSLSLSKNAQKKAAKATRFAAQKLERRAKEKEAKKAKKRIRAQKRAAGELEEDELQEDEEKKRAMKRAKTGAGQKHFAARVCIDLGFDDMMSDKASCYLRNRADVFGSLLCTLWSPGSHIAVFAAWVCVQCQPTLNLSVQIRLIHIGQRSDVCETGDTE